ncbi:hypothetical protein F5X71_08330 [Nocardia brasiliensis]|uniref:Recombinase domain-containing protein n=1 Tax=Nocardia brasiliensis TaxID=37326 RepID=A0A6G9XN32_NOCBR|nr:hypothetical protein F5X71_08330 [Nocardia brasiliensis]
MADRLNLDLVSNPPPVPVDPTTAVGRWTWSNVREVLTNPKHTGHMVWNRRGRKANKNRRNPVAEWVWSPQPVHEALVSMEDFLVAQQPSARHRSRAGAQPNSHPDTKRTYWFRSYLKCDHCDRRMFGKTRKVAAYYACQPKKGYAAEDHPSGGSFFVREQDLLEHLGTFLNEQVFGAYRRAALESGDADSDAEDEGQRKREALRAQIADVEARMRRLVRNLELLDDPDPDFAADINQRRAELNDERARLRGTLAAVEAEVVETPNLNLIDALPTGYVDIQALPYELARQLFEAFRLEVRYNKTHHRAKYRVTLTGQTLRLAADIATTALGTANAATRLGGGGIRRVDGNNGVVPIYIAPPAGIEPAT